MCVCVSQHMCVLRPSSSLAHLPRQKTPVSPAISQSDSWELDSGTRGGGGRREERNEKDGQKGTHSKRVAITWSPPPSGPSSSSPLWGPGVLLLRGHGWRGRNKKKKKNLPSCFTWHLCTCIFRVGRWGGGRDKASDKVGLQRLLVLLLHHPTADLCAPTDTSPSAWHLSLKWMPGFESATQAFLFYSEWTLSVFFRRSGMFCSSFAVIFFSSIYVTAGCAVGILCCFLWLLFT